MQIISCPICGTELELPENLPEDQHLRCSDCGKKFVIRSGVATPLVQPPTNHHGVQCKVPAQIVIVVLIAILGPVFAFAILSFTPAFIVSVIVLVLCMTPIVRRILFLKRITRRVSHYWQKFDRVIDNTRYAASIFITDEMFQMYSKYLSVYSHAEMAVFCWAALLRLYLCRVAIETNDTLLCNAFKAHIDRVIPGVGELIDNIIRFENNKESQSTYGVEEDFDPMIYCKTLTEVWLFGALVAKRIFIAPLCLTLGRRLQELEIKTRFTDV